MQWYSAISVMGVLRFWIRQMSSEPEVSSLPRTKDVIIHTIVVYAVLFEWLHNLSGCKAQ